MFFLLFFLKLWFSKQWSRFTKSKGKKIRKIVMKCVRKYVQLCWYMLRDKAQLSWFWVTAPSKLELHHCSKKTMGKMDKDMRGYKSMPWGDRVSQSEGMWGLCDFLNITFHCNYLEIWQLCESWPWPEQIAGAWLVGSVRWSYTNPSYRKVCLSPVVLCTFVCGFGFHMWIWHRHEGA